MDYSLLRIELERSFTEEIRKNLHEKLINELLLAAQVDKRKSITNMFNGIYFKVGEDFCEEIWAICQEAQKRTGYEGKIEYYVMNSPEYNAFCIESDAPDQPHIITINSAVIKNFTKDELLFIIGHEIGHLWTGNRSLQQVIQFIFNENKKIPFYYHNRIMYWQRLSELSADRFGLLACGDLEPAVSSFFKLTSGLDWRELGINIRSYIRKNDELLKNLKGEQAFDQSTHPINPVRVKALQLFSKSPLFNDTLAGNTLSADEKLEAAVQKLVEEHTALAEGLNHDRMVFMATGGLIVSGCDEAMAEDEYERIVSYISRFTLYPRKYLDEMVKSKNVQDKFVKSVVNILKENPSERDSLMNYLLDIVLADSDINQAELKLLVEIGVKIMGYSEKEVSQIIAGGLYTIFTPKVK
ncbi:MAG: M48 family metalloprotease [Candidatus Cloacimonetes bacterium]|nr:M48 family metalloprotease [Candidatus Cloacimonadota bacterium]